MSSIIDLAQGENLALVYVQTTPPKYKTVVVFGAGNSKLPRPAVNLQLTVLSGEVTVTRTTGKKRKLKAKSKLVIDAGEGPLPFANTDSEPCVCLIQTGDQGGPPYQPPKPPG